MKSKRLLVTLPDKEKTWLKTLAHNSGMSEAQVIRLLIRDAAKKVGLPDPDRPGPEAVATPPIATATAAAPMT